MFKQIKTIVFAVILLFNKSSVASSSIPAAPSNDTAILHASQVQDVFKYFDKHRQNPLASVKQSVRYRETALQARWVKALDSAVIKGPDDKFTTSPHKMMGDWLNYYILVEALKYGEIDAAKSAINDMASNLELRKKKPELLDIMRGNIRTVQANQKEGNELASVLVLLERSRIKFDYTLQEFKSIRASIASYAYNVPTEPATPLALTAANLAEKIKLNTWPARYAVYHGFSALPRNKAVDLDNLISVIEADWIDIAVLMLEKCKYLNVDVATLTAQNLYSKAKSVTMIKSLLKVGIPLLPNASSSVRSFLYAETNPIKRAQMLGLLKLTGSKRDQNLYKTILDDDLNVSVVDAIMKKSPLQIETKFLQPTMQRDSKWILKAIRFCGGPCLKVLLEERVPKPDTISLNDALNNCHDGTKAVYENLIKKYDQFYTDNVSKYPIEIAPDEESSTTTTGVIDLPAYGTGTGTPDAFESFSEFHEKECKFKKLLEST